jgi:ribosome maturation factor RimP
VATKDIAQSVTDALVGVLSAEGYDLLLVEYIPSMQVLRVYIDRDDGGDVGVTLDDCSSVSHLVGDILDAEGMADTIAGRYRLEVSSPGLDRPLTRPKDFQRFVGCQVKLGLAEAIAGQRNLTGSLVAADDRGVRMSVGIDGKELPLAYDQIRKARLVPDFAHAGHVRK